MRWISTRIAPGTARRGRDTAVMVPVEPPFDVADARRAERARLLELLRGVRADGWSRPTRCPGWSVLDLVVHLVGDDLAALSWHRDGHRGAGPPDAADEAGFIDWLDELQDQWVRAGRRMSARVAIELLGWLDGPTADLVASDDLTAVDAHVSWAGSTPVPRWLDHARDLTEYWLHRQQLLDALGLPADNDPVVVGRVLDILRWALPRGLRSVSVPVGSAVLVELHDLGPTRWTLQLGNDGWAFPREPSEPSEPSEAHVVASCRCSAEQAWRLLTNNLEPAHHGHPAVSGDAHVLAALLRTRAIIGHPGSAASGASAAVPGGWAAHPIDRDVDVHPGQTSLGDDGAPLPPGAPAIVALGALCGVRETADDDKSQQSFWVAEFARLADGRRIVLHDERGFTIGHRIVVHSDHGPTTPAVALDGLTRGDFERNVLAVVLPDEDDSPDEHPWTWLADLAARRGLTARADELRTLPYEVLLTDDLRARLAVPPPA